MRTGFALGILALLCAAFAPSASIAAEEDKEYLLRQASANGELSNIQNLLARGADVNGKNKRGYTALILAVRGEQSYAVKYLIGAGADVNAQDVDGDSPLMLAVTNGNAEFASLLLSSGADPDIKDPRGMTPLMQACALNKPDLAAILLKNRASVIVRDKDGNTPLLIAARSGSTEIVNLLLEAGADVRTRSPYGDTAETLAMRFSHRDTAAVLASYDVRHPRKAAEPPAPTVVGPQAAVAAAPVLTPAAAEPSPPGERSKAMTQGVFAVLCIIAMAVLL